MTRKFALALAGSMLAARPALAAGPIMTAGGGIQQAPSAPQWSINQDGTAHFGNLDPSTMIGGVRADALSAAAAGAVPQSWLGRPNGAARLDAAATLNATLLSGSTTAGQAVALITANATAAAGAQATASAAVPKATVGQPGGVAGLDGGGNVTAPINTPSLSLPDSNHPTNGGIRITYPTTYGSAYGNPYELRFLANIPLNNPLRLENDDPQGLAAWSYAGWDTALGNVHEHMAVGYGAGLKNGAGSDYNYIENSCYQTDGSGNGLASTTCPGADFMIQETGAAFSGSPVEVHAQFTAGSTSVAIFGGGNWPAGIDGQVIDTPVAYGMTVPGTTVVSGEGTPTIKLSSPATATTGETNGTVTRIGPTEYSQHDSVVFKHMGNIDYFAYVCARWGQYSCGPFLSLDRIHSRVGVNNPDPQFPLDVIGSIVGNVSGTSTNAQFGGGGALNAQVTPGALGQGTILHAFAVGTNQLFLNWDTNPSRLTFNDSNGSATPLQIRMDGSWQAQKIAHPVTAVSGNYTTSNVDCDTTLLVGAAATLTVPNVFPTGCRITVTSNTTGAVQIVAGGAETLGWYDTKAETGTYTLAGQYSSAVIETKSGYLATIERGQ